MTPPLLELRSVTTELAFESRRLPVVDDVSFTIDRGEIVGLVGESGSGKSMTARTIVRLLPPLARSRGQVLLDGNDLLQLSPKALRSVRANRVAMIFQDPRSHVDPLWTVGSHLTEGLRAHKNLGRAASRRRAMDLLSVVRITDVSRVLAAYPFELSGGMLQRVLIAGALAGDPELIIADEPTTALDVTIQAEIVAIFESLRRDRGLALLFITHDLDLASAICDRVVVLYAGRIVEEQPTNDLFASPLHPYTAALLRARPRIDARLPRLAVIPGRSAALSELPPGCPFHPRCEFAQERCREERPAVRALEPGKVTACLRTEEIGNQLAGKTVTNLG